MLHIAIPLLNELENIPALVKNIAKQNCKNFKIYFCVNQPDEWWGKLDKIEECKNNQASIRLIEEIVEFPFEIIDKSSLGQGWKGKKLGVGWARKTLTDRILEVADENDIIISLDADTSFSENYFVSIEKKLNQHPKAPALAVPYYHPLSGKEAEDRAILRYEIYMRHYLINLFRIESPYAFSALGSAIAMPVWALRKISGITPKKSGEDFYLLQKMVKFRPLLNWNSEKVYPAARFSDRVFFGTGPAMIKGNSGDWSSYPIYSISLFDRISEFYNQIPQLYKKNLLTPIDTVFGNTKFCFQMWENLRKNNKDLAHFTKAVHDKFDGLRILQFLKQTAEMENNADENTLFDSVKNIKPTIDIPSIFQDFSFSQSPISHLNEIRDYLCNIEDDYRQQAYKQYGK